jgi:Arc/MetJ-type ribon-helix-helix transcriptional regulator
MTIAITIRVPDEQAAAVDRLLAEGVFATRTAAYIAAVEAWLESDREQRLDRAIVDGYRRVPPTAGEVAAAEEQADRSVSAEPW